MHHINTHLHGLSSGKYVSHESDGERKKEIMSFHYNLSPVSSDSKLTVQLACLRCARMESKEFDAAASDSFGDLFATAMHHADEQVRTLR